MRDRPLFHPHAPDRRCCARYGLFYELSEDLLESICAITGQYSPFSSCDDTYYVPDLGKFELQAKAENLEVQPVGARDGDGIECGHLRELQRAVCNWRDSFRHAEASAIRNAMRHANESAPPAKRLRTDLLGTADFLLATIEQATRQAKTISLIGY